MVSTTTAAFVVIFLGAFLSVRCCKVPTPIITAYDDGFIRFHIPPQNDVETYGIEYQVYSGEEVTLDGGTSTYYSSKNQEQKFGARNDNGPSPLGQIVRYKMYKGGANDRECEVPGEYTIRELHPAESYQGR